MSDHTVIDAEAIEEPNAIAVVPDAPRALAVTPQVEASELVARLDVIRQAQETAMVEDVDYGVVPGTNKPTLLKPGAEKLSVLFQLDIQLLNEKNWGPDDHLTVVSRATVFHAPTGARLGYGEGMCTTRERKYGKRKAQRVCPKCGEGAVIAGKAEYGGGWLCWQKRGGCGAKFSEGDQAIESQSTGDIDNPDLPDTWNTILKMAEKRARVDAVLAVTGASALFTQDVEDASPASGSLTVADAAPAESEFQENVLPEAMQWAGFVHAAEWKTIKSTGRSKLLVVIRVPNKNGGKDATEDVWIDPLREEFTQVCEAVGDGSLVEIGADVSAWVGRPIDFIVTVNGQYRNHRLLLGTAA